MRSMTPKMSVSGNHIFFGTVVVMVLAVFISPTLLNQFMNFTIDGGTFIEKFHPAVYIIILICVIDFLKRRSFGLEKANAAFELARLWAAVAAGLAMFDAAGYSAVTINNFCVPLLLISLICTLDARSVIILGKVLILLLVVQTMLIFFEFFAGWTLLVVRQEMLSFRPAGFAGHPLEAGRFAVIALLLTRICISSYFYSRAFLLLFFTSLLVIGSRSALMIGTVLIIFELIWPFMLASKLRVRLLDGGFAFALVASVPLAMAAGGLNRLLERGIWDDSARSRIEVFDVFSLLSPDEMWKGVGYDRVQLYLDFLGQNYVESAFVAQVVVGGVVFAIVAHVLIIASVAAALKSSPTVFFCALAFLFSSIAFSSKSVFPLLLFFVVHVSIAGARLAEGHLEKWP